MVSSANHQIYLPEYAQANIALREHLSCLLPHNYSYCEIGVKEGEFFRIMSSRTEGHCVAIDLWEKGCSPTQDDAQEGYEKMKKYRLNFEAEFGNYMNVDIFHCDSIQAAKTMKNMFGYKFDMVYIDADHSYEAVKADLEAYIHLVKKGGYLAGHDFTEAIFPTGNKNGVIQAVKEFTEANGLTIHTTQSDFWKTFFIKI